MNLTKEERDAVLDLMAANWGALDVIGEQAFCKIAAGTDKRLFRVRDLSNNEISEWKLSDILFEINYDHNGDWKPYTAEDWREGWGEFVDAVGEYKLCGLVVPSWLNR